MQTTRFFAGLAIVASLSAQTEPYFPKPSYFRRHFARIVTHVELQPPVRLSDFVAGGTLELSMRNYLDLVMANNPDVGVQKLTVEFSRSAITRAFGIFDPLGIASFGATRTQTQSNTALAGASTLNQLSQPFSLQYQQLLETGTTYGISFNDIKSSTNSAYATFNPQLNSNINFSMTQPLLRGRGMGITRLPISIARSRLRIADYTLQDQVMQIIAAAENAYWDVVGARENLRVQEESLKLADAALARAQKELDLGATSPLEIYQPQANQANAQLGVSQARYRLAQTEDALRRQMGADLDPKIRTLPIVLTATVDPPLDSSRIDTEEAVATALRLRPDLKGVVQSMDVDDLNIKDATNRLRPDLSLTAQYGSSGVGGIFYPGANLINPQPVIPIVGGLGDALGGVFGFNNPVYGFGLTLRLPIKDRRTSADLSDAINQKRLDALRQRSTEENIRLQVVTAISLIESGKESIRIATIARDLAQKRVDADQKRYELGATTLFFVLASQADYVSAESNLVNQIINYRRNEINLLQRTGQLLEERGIVLQP
jgi:outer membrane protein TolC